MKILNFEINKIEKEVTDNNEINETEETKEDDNMEKVGFFKKYGKKILFGAAALGAAGYGVKKLIDKTSDNDDFDDDDDFEEDDDQVSVESTTTDDDK